MEDVVGQTDLIVIGTNAESEMVRVARLVQGCRLQRRENKIYVFPCCEHSHEQT